MLNLKIALKELGQPQAGVAAHCDVSPATIAQLINHNRWPKKPGKRQLKALILEFVSEHGGETAGLFKEVGPLCTTTATLDCANKQHNQSEEDKSMLLRKNRLSPQAREFFKLPRDPFSDEMREDGDVFLSDNIRYVRAAMRQTAEFGGFMAIVGESGAGKSTLRQDLEEWIHSFSKPITVISPYSELGMEGDKPIGKPLRAQNLIESVIKTLSPLEKVKISSEARARQMHQILSGSAEAGYRHVMVIEEAHRLAIPTIKHLKQFYELQDGFRKLLSIIMIGQTELEHRFTRYNPEIREVTQRCELVSLSALDDDLEAYVKHKFARVGVNYLDVIERSAIDAMRDRLRTSFTEGRGSARSVQTYSLCYPLAVNNLLSGAMNAAVSVCSPKVTDELVLATIRQGGA